MGNKNRQNNQVNNRQNYQPAKAGGNKVVTILLAVILVFVSVGGYIIINDGHTDKVEVASTNGIEIVKANITKPTFFQYEVNGKPMEVVAVKASDGTVRIAYNTCQVCKDSGKGYYKAEGSFLICQNCRNAFKYDEVDVARGGCNPVTIDNKIDQGDKYVIPHEVLVEDAVIFDRWKF